MLAVPVSRARPRDDMLSLGAVSAPSQPHPPIPSVVVVVVPGGAALLPPLLLLAFALVDEGVAWFGFGLGLGLVAYP